MDASARVLVLDDFAGPDSLFREAFGDRLTLCISMKALEREIASGGEWDVAFVDFALQDYTAPDSDDRTGLTGLLTLRQERPRTRIVSYTQPAESGRLLYMAAARHWFSADATLPKSVMTRDYIVDFVESVSAGRDPSNIRIIKWLESSHLIDELLKTPDYVTLWRAWLQFNGNEDAISKRTYYSKSQIRTFKDTTAEAVVQFKRAFEGIELDGALGHGGYSNLKGIISAFASENRRFFAAPDLIEAINARPHASRR